MIVQSPWKNLLPALGFLSLAVLLGSLVFQHRFREDLQVLLEQENLRVARLAASLLGPWDASAGERQERVRRIAELSDGRVTVVAPSGEVVAESHHDPENMDNHGDRPEIVAAREQGWGHSIRRSATLERDMVYTAVRLDNAAGEPTGFVRVARSLEQVEQLTASIEGTIWVAAAVVVLLGLLACYLFIERRILRQERIQPASAEAPGAPGTAANLDKV